MDPYLHIDGHLHAEDVSVRALAEQHGTPLYVYSRSHLRSQYRALTEAMSELTPLICYSVKANSNHAVIKTFVGEGAGLDVVSGGELFRALRAGADPSRIVFAGVGKTREEIEYALNERILLLTVESEPEARRISECANRLRTTAHIAFRVNPDVDPQTHKYISTGKKENKFGLDIERAASACALASHLPNLEIAGLHMHIGSQILTPEPFAEALGKLRRLYENLQPQFPTIRHLDIGGGIGIRYEPDHANFDVTAFAAVATDALQGVDASIIMEPGRFLVGNAGILVCRVQYVKESTFKQFVVVDAGMNDLIRPALYQAYHEVVPVVQTSERMYADLVGPICESGDFVAQDRELPRVGQDDLLAIRSAGAYAFSMASTYNSRPRAAELMVEGHDAFVVRERETFEDLLRNEVGNTGGA